MRNWGNPERFCDTYWFDRCEIGDVLTFGRSPMRWFVMNVTECGVEISPIDRPPRYKVDASLQHMPADARGLECKTIANWA